jgi:cell division protein FtsQ
MMNITANLLLALALALALAAVCGWLAQRPMFTLVAIRIEGAQGPLLHINHPVVRAAALPRLAGNFFTVDLQAVQGAFEGVPWVRRADVRRQWPNRLVVAIEEHKPLGLWGDGRLVNTFGELFAANQAEAEEDDLPELAGPSGTEKDVAQRLNDFRAWLAPLKREPVRVLLSPRYAWQVRLDSGLLVELGREQGASTLHERIGRLVRFLPAVERKLGRSPDYVDLRYPNGFAVRGPRLADQRATVKS